METVSSWQQITTARAGEAVAAFENGAIAQDPERAMKVLLRTRRTSVVPLCYETRSRVGAYGYTSLRPKPRHLLPLLPGMRKPDSRRRRAYLTRSLLLALGLLLSTSTNSQAAIFNVTDGDVTGLIAAINPANTNGEADTINLAPNGLYTLTTAASTNPDLGIMGCR